MATTVTYKGQTLTTVDNDTKTLQTAGTWMEDDLTLTDVSGGGGDEAETNDVTFIDYDGTALYSYTKAEFLALSTMPANPSHTGLIAQGWNWTLAQAQAYVTDNDYLCIGQVYRTADGKTHFTIDVDDLAVGWEFTVRYYASAQGGITINWGDGTADVSTVVNSAGYLRHTYTTAGLYDVTIEATSGTYELGYGGSNAGIFWLSNQASRATARCVKAIYIGDNCVKVHRSLVEGCRNIEKVTLPPSVIALGDSGSGATALILNGTKLKGFVIPSGCILQTYSVADSAPDLKYISFGYGSITSATVASRVTQTTPNLKMLTLPAVSTLANANVIQSGYTLERFCVPGTYTAIYQGYCRDIPALEKVTIPASVQSIADYAFTNTNIKEWHLLPTTPPTVANTRGLPTINPNGHIYVPYSADHSILEAYKTASNWTTLASYMVEESA